MLDSINLLKPDILMIYSLQIASKMSQLSELGLNNLISKKNHLGKGNYGWIKSAILRENFNMFVLHYILSLSLRLGGKIMS